MQSNTCQPNPSSKDIFYELENLSEIKDRTILKLFETDGSGRGWIVINIKNQAKVSKMILPQLSKCSWLYHPPGPSGLGPAGLPPFTPTPFESGEPFPRWAFEERYRLSLFKQTWPVYKKLFL